MQDCRDDQFKQPIDDSNRLIRVYETILSTTDDFAYIFDPSGRFLYANAQLLRVWAKTLQEIVGKTCLELGYPAWHAEMHQREIEEIVGTKLPCRGEVPFKGDSGISGVYDYIFKPVLNARGEVELIVGTTRDVTKRKEDEEKLKQAQIELSRRASALEEALESQSVSEKRYRFMADTVPQLVWTALPDGRFDYFNRRWFDYVGCNLAETQRQEWTSYVHPEDLPAAQNAWRRALTTAGDYEAELRLKRASDQTFRWHLVRAFPMKGDSGQVSQWVGTFTDIDDQRKLSGLMVETAAKLQLYFDSNIIGNVVADLNGTVYEANDEFLRIIGWSRSELLNREVRWDTITPPEHLDLDRRAIESARQTGSSEPYEKQYIRKDGSRIWVLVGFLIYEKTKAIAFVLDISARKRAEQELKDAQVKLKAYSEDLEGLVASRTARLHEMIAELEHFSYAIVHDLRAPLRAMEGYADMVEEELNSGDLALSKEYIRRIKLASRRMDHLIADSLNYSKTARQDLVLGPVDLFQLIDDLTQTYPNLRAETLDLQIDSDLPIVLGNQAALTQCFSNLLGNAVKFGKPGQKPRVVIRAEPPPPSARLLSLPGSRGQVRIWVEDNGVGIPARFHDRVFDLFQRATKEHEGTGLGLAIVRKVVERMNGRVGLESEEGKGSRFWVDLLTAA